MAEDRLRFLLPVCLNLRGPLCTFIRVAISKFVSVCATTQFAVILLIVGALFKVESHDSEKSFLWQLLTTCTFVDLGVSWVNVVIRGLS